MSAVLSAPASVSSSAAIASVAAGAAVARLAGLATTSRNAPAPPVLHRTAQPISLDEFVDALRAASPPRFPNARSIYGRRVGLAISGGVDSMALAYLCSALRLQRHDICIADAPIHGFNAMIIDHGLREGSAAEAAAVAKEMNKMGHRQQVIKIRWPEETYTGAGTTALETNARRLRYRCLARNMAQLRIVSLLLAHHEDDQYETILMRLLSGYGLHGGIRGLRGMRAANDLPECHGIYGAHRSGFWDDQKGSSPYVQLRPSRRERRQIKADLRSEMDYAVLADELRAGGGGEWDRLAAARLWDHAPEGPVPLPAMRTEDLGVVAYRPLLPFAKERLVATCTANGVTWFEDHTNADPTLTMRNALRHMVRAHELPQALQKPAVLQLAARCDAAARQHEAQARRLLVRHGMIRAFSPNIGTLAVRLPQLKARDRARPWQTPATASHDAQRTERRRMHLRTVAALAVRTLLSYVTPEDSVTAVSQLQAVVDALFPELAGPGDAAAHGYAKGFSLCGVHCTPLPTTLQTPRAWHLSRAPHFTSTLSAVLAASARTPLHTGSLLSVPQHPKSLPFATFPAVALALRWDKDATDWPWSSWGRWVLYDGRFWIRLRTRLPVVTSLQPFSLAYSKPFREALARGHPRSAEPDTAESDTPDADGSQLARFQNTLKAHAPGKVRYTLPGIYVAADIGWALRGEPYWPPALRVTNSVAPREKESMRRHQLSDWECEQRDGERAQWPAPDRPAQHLLALPTIDVHVPGLRKWVQWEVRYKKVNTGLLDASLRQS